MFEFDICYSLDSNYTEQTAVSISSILKNSKDDENINFYILDGGLSSEDRLSLEKLKNIKDFSIKYIEMDKKIFENCPLLKAEKKGYENYHVTLPTYFRFKLSSLFPNLDKILYLDCDVIIKSSLKELFLSDIKDKSVLMVPDSESEKEAKRLGTNLYFNAGVMLINLDFWRKNNIENALFSYSQEHTDTILWQDQDVVNVVLQENIGELNKKWNYQYFQYEEINDKELMNSCIIHLAGRFKPWLMPFEHPVYELYYYYLSFTDWRNKIVDYKQASFGKYLRNNIGGSVTNIILNATNDDINNIYKEIDTNYKYTEKIVKDSNDEIKSNKNAINKAFDDIHNIFEKIYCNSECTNKKFQDIFEKIYCNSECTNKKFQDISDLIDKNHTEIISYIKEEVAQLYEEVINNNIMTNRKIDEKDYENYKKFEIVNQQIHKINDNLENKVNYDDLKQKLEQTEKNLSDILNFYKSDINEIKTRFDEELNKQRIKYEKKLIEMENTIASFENKYEPKKKSIFQKIKNKFKKRKNA